MEIFLSKELNVGSLGELYLLKSKLCQLTTAELQKFAMFCGSGFNLP